MHAAKTIRRGLLLGFMAVLMVDLGAAEAPLPYHYPVPGGANALPQSTPSTAAVVNEGITADKPAGAAPGYVSPSLLIASTPPPVPNYQPQPQYAGEYQGDADSYKHVYVHVAPEEPAEPQSALIVPTPKPKKHYKIVFIKTPTVQPPAAAYVNLPQPDQEKTLIYVLSNKPHQQQQLVVSTPAPTQPAKPEVFFIRYKNNEAQTQPQVTFANGGQQQQQQVGYTKNAQPIKPLTDSYGVPLAPPLNGAQYSTLPSAAPATNNNAIKFNSI